MALADLLVKRYPRSLALPRGGEVVVRPLVARDESDLVELFRHIPEGERLFLKDDVADPAIIARWCREIDYDQVLPLLAFQDGRLVADATLHRQRWGWMTHVGTVRVVVHPQARRRGIATALIDELVELGVELGLGRLAAEFMAEQREALRVFEQAGFYMAAVIPQQVRDLEGRTRDFVVMVYDLLPPEPQVRRAGA